MGNIIRNCYKEVLLISLTIKVFVYSIIFPINTLNIWFKSPMEALKISPQYFLIKFFIDYGFEPLKPALKNLDENVCFLNDSQTSIYNMSFIVSCDWCSICNGIIETSKQNIIKTPELLKKINFNKLDISDRYLNFILSNRSEKLSNEQIEQWCIKTFGTITINYLILSKIYLKLEMIETRWCPFKRSKELYYRNVDKRYLEPTEKMMYEVGKILSTDETITCNNCPKIVNKEWKYSESNKNSIFQPLLNYLIEDIKIN